MDLMNFIQEFLLTDLLILPPSLFFLGGWIKKAFPKIKRKIPLILTFLGASVSLIWTLASPSYYTNGFDIFNALFTSITQGILSAGAAVTAHEIIKNRDKTTKYKHIHKASRGNDDERERERGKR